MKVCIYGAGAMGTVLGAYLAKNEVYVDLVSRNKNHIEGLKKTGAVITGTTKMTQKVHAFLVEEMKEHYDIIFLMTKQQENKTVVSFLKDFLTPDGIICTMQNGIPEFEISKIIGNDKVYGCAMSWGATMIGNGVVELTTIPTPESLSFTIGSFGKANETILSQIQSILSTMGNVSIESNWIGARYAKLLVNSAFSGLSVCLKQDFGTIAKNKKSRKVAQAVIKECIDVAKANQIKIEPIQGKDIAKFFDYHNQFQKKLAFYLIPIAMKKHQKIRSSMIQDIENHRLCEIDGINGVILNFAQEASMRAPLNELIVQTVHEIESGKKSMSINNLDLFLKLVS